MNLRYMIQFAGIPVAIALAVVSCGGGSGGQASTTGTGAVGVSSGPITGFGSVFVNGVEYDTSGSQIVVNGASASQSALKVGMMVKVDGRIDADGTAGTATKIEYDDDVEGVVDSVDAAHNSLVVMGQTVAVDNLTVFHGATGLADLQAGNLVEVSGMADSSGVIHATLIVLKKSSFAAGDHLNIRGTVSNLDTVNSTFDIGAQAVTYATATLNGLPSGLQNGMTVQVMSTQGVNSSGQLVASAVNGISNDMHAADGDEMEVEGLVTAFTSATDFSVNGQAVTTTTSTVFVHGSASDLALNSRVEVEGSMNSSGVLVASKVSIKPRTEIEAVGDVQAVAPTNGTVTIMGLQFTLDVTTAYRDESATHARFFRLKDIAVGDRLDVRGYQSSDGTLIATRVERSDTTSGASVELQARVTTVTSPDLQMLGITVLTDGSTSFGIGDTAVTSADFFTQVTAGQVVDVRGTLVGDGSIQATSVQIVPVRQDH